MHACIARRTGFTLNEVVISMGLVSIIMAGLVTLTVFGVKMYYSAQMKLTSSDGARMALGKIADDVRAGKIIRVGNRGGTTFTEATGGLAQQGNALQINFTTNSTNYILYYRDTADQSLKRLSSSTGEEQTLAHSITNAILFRAEDYAGNLLTNYQNNRVIQLLLEFYQTQYPTNPIGAGHLLEYYKLESRITRRAIE